MAFVITEPCVGVKDKACFGVCPVDAIQEAADCPGETPRGDAMLYIDPDECICCGACEPACPVDAIFDEDMVPDQWLSYIELNAQAFAV